MGNPRHELPTVAACRVDHGCVVEAATSSLAWHDREMFAEPTFPFCPCWICIGDFDCCYVVCGQDLPDAALSAMTTWPWHWFSRGASHAIALIRRYQTEISANRPAICRFRPSCSHYGVAALERYGLVRGSRLIVKRLARCRSSVPRGTLDPIPSRASI